MLRPGTEAAGASEGAAENASAEGEKVVKIAYTRILVLLEHLTRALPAADGRFWHIPMRILLYMEATENITAF